MRVCVCVCARVCMCVYVHFFQREMGSAPSLRRLVAVMPHTYQQCVCVCIYRKCWELAHIYRQCVCTCTRVCICVYVCALIYTRGAGSWLIYI